MTYCAWCGCVKHQGRSRMASHGICVRCLTRELLRQREEARRQEDARLKGLANRRRDEAALFNARIHIPVGWDVAEKLVVSGLSERSWGDGRSRSTVEHVLLLEDFQAGRLKRSRGSFLCNATAGKFNTYLDFGDAGVRFTDGDGQAYRPAVTCKACLKVLERLGLLSPQA